MFFVLFSTIFFQFLRAVVVYGPLVPNCHARDALSWSPAQVWPQFFVFFLFLFPPLSLSFCFFLPPCCCLFVCLCLFGLQCFLLCLICLLLFVFVYIYIYIAFIHFCCLFSFSCWCCCVWVLFVYLVSHVVLPPSCFKVVFNGCVFYVFVYTLVLSYVFLLFCCVYVVCCLPLSLCVLFSLLNLFFCVFSHFPPIFDSPQFTCFVCFYIIIY